MELKSTEIYRRFERLSITGQAPTNAEWDELEVALCEAYPQFRDFMDDHRYHLTDKEHKTCLLTRLGIRPSAISSMLGTSRAYVSIMRSKLLQKLFSVNAPLREFDRQIQEMA